MRLKSVKNIEKITKSMKMIATTKLTKAQRTMDTARVYGQASEGT
jgi:F-type H+-transporting ATPase subunit gamma